MSTRASWSVLAAAGVLSIGGLALAGAAGAQDPASPSAWIHVQVTGDEDGPEQVHVNLPLTAAEPMLALVPHRIMPNGQLDVGGRRLPVNVSAVRDAWRALMAVGDAEFVAVDDPEATVRIARIGDRIEVRVSTPDAADGETVDVRLPIAVIDALLSGDGDQLNVAAAVERLSGLRGDIVRVTDDDRQIRIWIDETAAP